MRNFLRHFLTTFWQLRTAFFDFRNYDIFVWLLHPAQAIFSSFGAASGVVSLKLDAEALKVAEKDALRYLKTFFFVSFVLKYAHKKKENSW